MWLSKMKVFKAVFAKVISTSRYPIVQFDYKALNPYFGGSASGILIDTMKLSILFFQFFVSISRNILS